MIFEWDDNKSTMNLKNHKISFEEARTVFSDPLSITVADPEHSETEYRFIDIGMSEQRRLLVRRPVQAKRNRRLSSESNSNPPYPLCLIRPT